MAIAYDVAGYGPAVLLLHAGVCDRRMWDPQWPVLAEAGYRTVRCDLRGFGDTPALGGPHTDSDDVAALLGALAIDRVALIGASFGGSVALEVAARWPDQVSALALICAGMPGHEPGPELTALGHREEQLIEAGDIEGAVDLHVVTRLGPEAGPEVREKVRQMQRRAFDLQLAEEIAPDPVEVDLARITAPCLALSGAHDLPDFRQIAASLPGLLRHARHVELPWAGHLPSMERPAEVNQLLTGFLAEQLPPCR